jgi:hypothetical protein
MKKEWKTPELIVFLKAEPEDSILTHCKSSKNTTNSINSTKGNHCQAAVDDESNCGACQSNGGGLS